MATSAYKLVAPGNDAWLSPEEITERLQKEFAGVFIDAQAAQEQASQILQAYERLMAAGICDDLAPSLSEIEAQWSGAIQVWVWEAEEADPGVYLMALNRAPINVGFTKSFQPRRRRAMANRLAKLLGYDVESHGND